MSQPIMLFNADGEQVILYAPTYAKQQVSAGLLFSAPPKNSEPTLPTAEVSTVADTSANPFTEMSVRELKDVAKSEGVSGYSRMKKAELIEVLTRG